MIPTKNESIEQGGVQTSTKHKFCPSLTLCSLEKKNKLKHKLFRDNAEEIIADLQSRIDHFKTRHEYPFTWKNRLFTKPPKKTIEDMEMNEEEIHRMEELLKDNARKRLGRNNSCHTFLSLISIHIIVLIISFAGLRWS